MEHTSAVWQRVGAQPAPDAAGLEGLIATEWTAASTYLHLSRKLQGHYAEVLRRLFQEEQAHANCLKGIYALITGETPKVASPVPQTDTPELTLRRCYGQEMRSLAAYEARSADPQYGAVYQKLAQQEREHCWIVLELIGQLQK